MLIRPHTAFVTFLKREDKDFAIQVGDKIKTMSKKYRPKLFGRNVKLEEPKNPSDYCWENMGNRKRLVRWKEIIATIGFLILFSFFIDFIF